MSQNKNPLQAIIDAEKAKSGVNELSKKQISHKVAVVIRDENPDWRNNVISARKKSLEDPEHQLLMKKTFEKSLEKRKESIKKKWQDPDYREKMAESNRKKAQDPAWLEKVRNNAEKRKGSVEWSQKMSKILKEKYKDPEARSKIAESNRKKSQDPTIRKKLSDKAKERTNNPEYKELLRQRWEEKTKKEGWSDIVEKRNKTLKEKLSKPLMTRHGAFSSTKEAAKFYQVDGANIGYWLSNKPDEFYRLTKEEYEKLKHIPLKSFTDVPHPSRKKKKQIKS